jgi:hypothetical protein
VLLVLTASRDAAMLASADKRSAEHCCDADAILEKVIFPMSFPWTID